MTDTPNNPLWYSGQGPDLSMPVVGVGSAPLAEASFLHDGTPGAYRSADIPKRFLWLFDLAALAACFAAAGMLAPIAQPFFAPGGALRAGWMQWLRPVGQVVPFPPLRELAWIFVVMAPSVLLFMQALGGYRPILEQSRLRLILTCLLAPLAGLASVTLVTFAIKYQTTSRLLVFSFVSFSIASLFLYRSVVRAYKRARFNAGHYTRETVLIGPTSALEQLARYFHRNVPPTFYRLAGYLAVSAQQPAPFAAAGGVATMPPLPLLGHAADLGDVLIHRPIHEAVAVETAGVTEWLPAVIEACDYFRVTLRIVPEALLAGRLRDLRLMSRSGGLELPQIVLKPALLDSDALFVKRALDLVLSATLLVALSPLLLIVAIAIKLTTPHLPVLYTWQAVGCKGRQFTGYKFTTMVENAENLKAGLMHLNEMSGPVFKIKNDPRMTRLGRFLRKYSINEMPQLWSVLKGDMSLVGPRPAGPHELARYELWHKRKLAVQPGITCLWQVRGRNRISDFDEWVRMDLEYIDNWSLLLDLKILARTVWVVLKGTGS